MENYVGTILTYAIKKRFENEKLSSGIEKEKENIPSYTQHGLHNAKQIIKVPIQMFSAVVVWGTQVLLWFGLLMYWIAF